MVRLSEVHSASTSHRPHVSHASTGLPWTQILEIGQTAAAEAGLKGDYLTDCAMDFVAYITTAQKEREDIPEETLTKKARIFARSVAYRLQHHNRRVQSLAETAEDGKMHTMPEPASRELGPEELSQSADFLRRLLEPLANFSPAQQHLFVERILRNKRLVDLAEETGRSANALAQSISSMIKRLQTMLEAGGIDMEEIRDYLSGIDQGHAS